jgi:hypothetical protein
MVIDAELCLMLAVERQVGEGVSPTLDVEEFIRDLFCNFKWYLTSAAGVGAISSEAL